MPETRRLDGPLLCLDVSSSRTGHALFLPDGALGPFGVIAPRKGAPPADRIDFIAARVGLLIDEHRPAAVLLEWCSGQVHRRMAGRSNGTGLAVLGQAQGAVRQLCRGRGVPVATVAENDWTGSVAKATRAGRIALEFPEYRAFRDAGRDGGLDAADAIGLGLWQFARLRESELLARAGTANV